MVVPSSWPRSCTDGAPPGQATTQNYLTSDVRVSSAHPVYGTAPWTHQAGLCGQPGAFVQFAAEYIASGDIWTYGDQGEIGSAVRLTHSFCNRCNITYESSQHSRGMILFSFGRPFNELRC